MNEDGFKTILINIARNLSNEDLKRVKYYYEKDISESVLEKITSPIELLQALEQHSLLRFNKYDDFVELLIQIGKQQLVNDNFPENVQAVGKKLKSVEYKKDDKLTMKESEIKNFKLKKIKVIGSGGYGKVYLCTDENTGKKIATKSIEIGNTDSNEKAKKEVEKLKQDISLFQTLIHKRVVEYYGITCTSTTVSISMEYMEGGTLHDKIIMEGALDEKSASEKSFQILSGLIYLHSKNIIHRNIKSANILLDFEGNCKLADYGISKQIQTIRSQAGCKTTIGTPYWMSPEVINSTCFDIEYEKKADIWSFGCTVLEMLTTKPPWFELPPMSAIFHIATRPTVPHLPDNSSTSCVTFVNDCFISDPALRPNASQLLLYDWVRR